MIDRLNKSSQSLATRVLLKLTPRITLSTLIFLLGTLAAQAQWQQAELEWRLKLDRDGIKVYLGKVPGSKFRAVFSVMELAAEPKQLAALVMDLENCPNWVSMCKAATVIKRVSSSESYVYSVINAPFPVRDRDVVAHVKWHYDRSSGKISMRSDTTPERLPQKNGLVRVQYATSEWHFTPNGNGAVLVEYYAHVDPNGNVPAWLTNLVIEESPHKTLVKMRKLILRGNYIDAEVAFISNVGHDADSSLKKFTESPAK